MKKRSSMRQLATIAYIVLLASLMGLVLHRRFSTVTLSNPVGKLESLSGDFRFAVIGDSHSFNRSINSALTKAVSRNCAFVIHTGDFVDNDDAIDYRVFMSKLAPHISKIPVYLTKGNHETYAPGDGFSTIYNEYIPQANLSFSISNNHFIILDSSLSAHGPTGINYLTDYLDSIKKHKTANVFVFTHYPPQYDKIANMLPDDESAFLIKLLKKGKIDYLISGHYHNKQLFQIADSYLIVNGSGGGSFEYPSEETNYLEIEIKDGNVTHTFIDTKQDVLYWALILYVFNIYLPRHAAIACLVISLIILRELWSLRRRKPA